MNAASKVYPYEGVTVCPKCQTDVRIPKHRIGPLVLSRRMPPAKYAPGRDPQTNEPRSQVIGHTFMGEFRVGGDLTEIAGEHLIRACHGCGFLWAERCADWTEDAEDDEEAVDELIDYLAGTGANDGEG